MTQNAYEKIRDFQPEDGVGWDDVLKEYGPCVYELINAVLGAYMEIEPDDKKVLSTWIMAAAFKDGFLTMPILYISASKGSGKSRLLELIRYMLPESITILNPTEASLYRLASTKRCLIIDEAEKEKISNKDRVNLTEILNSCYKRGGSVTRYESRYIKEEKTTKYVAVEYPTYTAIALANTFGLAGIIEDRAITIVLRKTRNPEVTGVQQYFETDPIIQVIRNWLSGCCGGICGYLSNIYGVALAQLLIYNKKYKYIYNLPLSTVPDEVKLFLEKSGRVEVKNLDGRAKELWTPLWEISATFDPALTDNLIRIALEREESKLEDNIEFDRDTNTAIRLWEYLSDLPEAQFSPADFRRYVHDAEGLTPSEARKHWMSPEWIGHFMRRIKVVLKKIKTNRTYIYKVSKSRLRDYLEARSAMPDKDAPPPSTPSQRHIVDSTPNSAQPKAKGEAEPIPPPSKSKADAVLDRPDLIPAASADKAKPPTQPRQGSPNLQGENPPGIESRNPAQAQNPGKGHGICDRCGKSAPLYYYPYSDPVSLACVDCMNLAQHREED